MKKTLILLTACIISIAINTQVVDDRDYPEDAHEVYVLSHHIGQLYTQDLAFEFTLTGKRL